MVAAPAVQSATANLQHLQLLAEKRERLTVKHLEAEEALLVSIARALRAIPECDRDAAALQWFMAYRAVAEIGHTTRWTAATGWDHRRLQARASRVAINAPNGPEGSWQGCWPLALRDSRPATGVSVVYLLLDPQMVPCYVGSTHQFKERLTQHRRDAKDFIWWAAYPCPDRESAYQMEDRLLREHKPYLNKRASR